MKALDVNFISSFITPLETQASGVGRYDQNISGRLDEVLQMLEERDMQLSLNIWFHAFLSETVWGGGNIRWNTNPYRQITEAKDFYRSEDAWKAQENLYRCLLYTSDAADERSSVDLGGRRIIKKKKRLSRGDGLSHNKTNNE